MTMIRAIRAAALTVLLAILTVPLLAQGAFAQTFPKLTGGVVDNANLLPPDVEARLTEKLDALERQSGRQLVVATLPDLQGYDIADYANRLFRTWGIGQKDKDDGALLIVAPNERKVRIEVGYGLEGVLTDAQTSLIIQNDITPRFKASDMPGGVEAGVDRIATLLKLPPEEAKKQAAAAAQAVKKRRSGTDAGDIFTAIFWLFIIFFVILPIFFGRRRYGRRYGSGGPPVVIWGGNDWGSGGGSSWGGGGGSDWGGGGGFSGGGGSSGGGGASGSW